MSLVGTRPPTEDEWVKYELHHRSRIIFGDICCEYISFICRINCDF